jgi:tetratricopeptide (TPR) repeat protein
MLLIVAGLFLLSNEAPLAPAYVSADYESRDPQYVDCLRLIASDLEIGRIGAQQWAVEGGGAPAQHCLAIADIAAGFPGLGAVRLMELADRTDAGDEIVRARIRTQAAVAFLDAGNNPAALAAINDALIPTEPYLADLDLIAAAVFAEQEDWRKAEEAVTRAEEAETVSADGFVIRARARAALARDDAAAEDVIAALKLDPENLDALVLRGELMQRGIYIKATYRQRDEQASETR